MTKKVGLAMIIIGIIVFACFIYLVSMGKMTTVHEDNCNINMKNLTGQPCEYEIREYPYGIESESLAALAGLGVILICAGVFLLFIIYEFDNV